VNLIVKNPKAGLNSVDAAGNIASNVEKNQDQDKLDAAEVIQHMVLIQMLLHRISEIQNTSFFTMEPVVRILKFWAGTFDPRRCLRDYLPGRQIRKRSLSG
jgi:hypothetical protein